MGLEKSAWIEAMERGWTECDSYVCANCVEDFYLKEVIEKNSVEATCDYCGAKGNAIAAPVECIQAEIASAVDYFFCEPSKAGVPWDEGWVVEPTDSVDVLLSLNLVCNDELFEDIAASFTNTEWVPAARGNWVSSHKHELLAYSWQSFVYAVKHKTRYFFSSPIKSEDCEYDERSPSDLLFSIGTFVSTNGLCRLFDAGEVLYRARIWDAGADAPTAQNIGAPPPEKAAAGRMNPAGIPYLYLAKEPQTALAETLSRPPCVAGVGVFEAIRGIRLLDLASLPQTPSIFDSANRESWEELTFLSGFVDEITVPIAKDGREHVSYVPSQVVSEYFAQVFADADGNRLDGVIYPSTVRPSGQNVVLFPSENGDFDDKVAFRSSYTQRFETWPELQDGIT